MGGHVHARYNLGYTEAQKHVMISAGTGHDESLDKVKSGFRNGIVTKDEYEGALRAYHNSQLEVKSDMRDKVAAVRNQMGSSWHTKNPIIQKRRRSRRRLRPYRVMPRSWTYRSVHGAGGHFL